MFFAQVTLQIRQQLTQSFLELESLKLKYVLSQDDAIRHRIVELQSNIKQLNEQQRTIEKVSKLSLN